jgi:hypothetical protein
MGHRRVRILGQRQTAGKVGLPGDYRAAKLATPARRSISPWPVDAATIWVDIAEHTPRFCGGRPQAVCPAGSWPNHRTDAKNLPLFEIGFYLHCPTGLLE